MFECLFGGGRIKFLFSLSIAGLLSTRWLEYGRTADIGNGRTTFSLRTRTPSIQIAWSFFIHKLDCIVYFRQMMTSFELYFQEKCQVDNMFMHPDLPVDRVTVALAPCVSIREFQSPDLEITAILMVYIRIISLDNFSVPRHSIF